MHIPFFFFLLCPLVNFSWVSVLVSTVLCPCCGHPYCGALVLHCRSDMTACSAALHLLGDSVCYTISMKHLAHCKTLFCLSSGTSLFTQTVSQTFKHFAPLIILGVVQVCTVAIQLHSYHFIYYSFSKIA